ncbi:cytochrome c1 [Devosia rhodophyticola]|uniref:Cytochrome c1 n=1 Tax=Devosia rhodophyticola TaxID=3026423 RepID=A0ABY7YUL5_9HYPH|nr:cytochrome c1 [Devosia rhodophyticola]WDR05061.1 cytochrome c1 [Devosia rhodophyticola]
MLKIKTILAAVTLSAICALPATAQEHETVHIEKQNWSFAGIFGTYDTNQLRRGFQVFREVCSSCHSANLIAFRTLAEEGGPHFSEGQVKALSAEYDIADPSADDGTRKGVASDFWPAPFVNEQEARDANGGALPPDFSVLAKARGVTDAFPWWVTNYFTGYAEGGPDYIHALMNSYEETPPEGVEIPEGKHYNAVFPGHAIGMAPPLADGIITYVAEEGQEPVPETVDQYSKDVSAYMMWLAEPGLVSRKETGFKVLLFLILFAGLMYATKRKIWSGIEH